MNELLDIIAGLDPEERRDLITVLSLKYRDDFLQANRFVYWPNSLKQASERVRKCLGLDKV